MYIPLVTVTRRYSGGSARTMARRHSGRTGIVLDFRLPPLLSRGVRLSSRWSGRHFAIDGDILGKFRLRTMDPIFVPTTPGRHSVSVLDQGGRMSHEAEFDVAENAVMIASIFPAVDSHTGGKNVRAWTTIEVTHAGSSTPILRTQGKAAAP